MVNFSWSCKNPGSVNFKMKTAIICGATGLVGEQLLKQLLDSPVYEKVISLVRTHQNIKHPKYAERIIDFERIKESLQEIKADDAFCCLGTTMSKAGSKERQYHIDHDYVIDFAKGCIQTGVKQIAVVSSIGADKNTRNFYLKTKGEMEADIIQLPFEGIHFMRPSFLLGDRKEFRFGEKIGIFLARIIGPLLSGNLKKYKGIEVSAVAKAMIAAVNSGEKGVHVYHYDEITELAKAEIKYNRVKV